ncbi:MAG: ECF transporter S component [Candidatus Fournierella pullistercoris]|uniref:Riboflavin transporter n=1 Tax=Candidatus Allofournierella pullistercoris TaxID=2838597 RepID=A0A948T3S8_9FIRM|nr:ECF transporter S component [Candidatus Fournierella pullistercoris]
MTKSTLRVRNLVVTAMLSAVAAVLMMLSFSLPMLIPGFVKMDVSELPALLAAFSMGPAWGVLVCLLKNLLNLIVGGTTTAGVGELCNFLLGAAFVASAGLVYQRNKTLRGAVVASLLGAAVMAVVSLPVNYFVIYPVYSNLYGGMDLIIEAYQALRPDVNGLLECLLIFNTPFTLVKGLLTSVLAFVVYKPLSPMLHGRKKSA